MPLASMALTLERPELSAVNCFGSCRTITLPFCFFLLGCPEEVKHLTVCIAFQSGVSLQRHSDCQCEYVSPGLFARVKAVHSACALFPVNKSF